MLSVTVHSNYHTSREYHDSYIYIGKIRNYLECSQVAALQHQLRLAVAQAKNCNSFQLTHMPRGNHVQSIASNGDHVKKVYVDITTNFYSYRVVEYTAAILLGMAATMHTIDIRHIHMHKTFIINLHILSPTACWPKPPLSPEKSEVTSSR